MSTPEPPPCPPGAKTATTAGLALAMTAMRCDSARSTASGGSSAGGLLRRHRPPGHCVKHRQAIRRTSRPVGCSFADPRIAQHHVAGRVRLGGEIGENRQAAHARSRPVDRLRGLLVGAGERGLPEELAVAAKRPGGRCRGAAPRRRCPPRPESGGIGRADSRPPRCGCAGPVPWRTACRPTATASIPGSGPARRRKNFCCAGSGLSKGKYGV